MRQNPIATGREIPEAIDGRGDSSPIRHRITSTLAVSRRVRAVASRSNRASEPRARGSRTQGCARLVEHVDLIAAAVARRLERSEDDRSWPAPVVRVEIVIVPQPLERLMLREEVAEMLLCSTDTLDRERDEGMLRMVKVRSRWSVEPSELRSYLERNRS